MKLARVVANLLQINFKFFQEKQYIRGHIIWVYSGKHKYRPITVQSCFRMVEEKLTLAAKKKKTLVVVEMKASIPPGKVFINHHITGTRIFWDVIGTSSGRINLPMRATTMAGFLSRIRKAYSFNSQDDGPGHIW